jgi:hypothetical protein
MANTYTLIQAQTLASAAATVTFSSIPATYTDLVLRLSARNNDGGGGVIRIYFNGDTTASSGYSSTGLRGDGTSASSPRSTPASSYSIDTNAETANTFTSLEMYIPNYLATTSKQISVFNAMENNATAAKIEAFALLNQNTTISSINIFTSGSLVFSVGSSFYLYGIKNS